MHCIVNWPETPVALPVRADEFESLLGSFSPLPDKIALGVSGGPDSMALAFCAQRWAVKTQTHLVAFIVDHMLRDESAREAQAVQKDLHDLGIQSEILRWEHPPLLSRIHNTARKARYRLMTEACQRHGITHLLLGHQRDDQAETILMRLAKGSGIDGLAGMSSHKMTNGIHLLRPFLTLPKDRLIATCAAASISFVMDASNNKNIFARGRLRHVMPLLADEGFTTERLIDMGARASTAKDALDHYTHLFLQGTTKRDASGALHINLVALCAEPRAIRERALIASLQHIHSEDYPPEYASVVALSDALCCDVATPPRTLHGCIINRNASSILVTRETDSIGTTAIHRGETIVWDQRWRVSLSSDAPDELYTVKPLGLPEHALLDSLAPTLRRQIPQARARASLPSLWLKERLIWVPPFNLNDSSSMSKAELALNWPPLRA